MARIFPNHTSLCSKSHIPIAQLSPCLESVESRSIQAIVTLTWPYSSASNSITFLFSEPDFRLRNSRGQVRVEFSGLSGKSIVKAGVSSGDRVILSLEGVEWIQDESSICIPGRGVEFKLRFTDRFLLQFQREGSDNLQEIHVDRSLDENSSLDPKNVLASEPECMSDISSSKLDKSVSGEIICENNLYSSPAFLKRARMSYGSLFDLDLDTFIEADGSIQGKGRKKSRSGLTWGYRYPSPDLEVEERTEDLSRKVVPNTPKTAKSAMVDEGVQTNEDNSIQILDLGKSVAEPVEKGRSPSIPIITQNLTQDEPAIKELHLSIVDENELINQVLSDLNPTETDNGNVLMSSHKSLIPIEGQGHLLPLVKQPSISGNFDMENTQPVVTGIEIRPAVYSSEVENHGNDSESNGLDQVQITTQDSSIHVTISELDSTHSTLNIAIPEKEGSSDHLSQNHVSDTNMLETQSNSPLFLNFTSEPQEEKKIVENSQNDLIQLFDASLDQGSKKHIKPIVQDLKDKHFPVPKGGSDQLANFLALPISSSSTAISGSDSECLTKEPRLAVEDEKSNSFSVKTGRSLKHNHILPKSVYEADRTLTSVCEVYDNSSLNQRSENESLEGQDGLYQEYSDSESHEHIKSYNGQNYDENTSEQDSLFFKSVEKSRKCKEEDFLSKNEMYKSDKELPTYIDLVSSDDEKKSSISSQSDINMKDFDENGEVAEEEEDEEIEEEDEETEEEDEETEEEEVDKVEEVEMKEIEEEDEETEEEDEETEEEEVDKAEEVEMKEIEEEEVDKAEEVEVDVDKAEEVEVDVDKAEEVEVDVDKAEEVEVEEVDVDVDKAEEVEVGEVDKAEEVEMKEIEEEEVEVEVEEVEQEKKELKNDKKGERDCRQGEEEDGDYREEIGRNDTTLSDNRSDTVESLQKDDSQRIESTRNQDNSEKTDGQQADTIKLNFLCKENLSKNTSKSPADKLKESYKGEKIKQKESSTIGSVLGTDLSQETVPQEISFINKSTINLEDVESYQSRSISERNFPESQLGKSQSIIENEVDDSKRILRSMRSRTSSKLPDSNSNLQSRVNRSRSRGLGHDASFEIALSSLDSPSKRRSPPSVDVKIRFARKLRTELSEYTPLKLLRQHLRERLDVLAIIASDPAIPKRVKGGPRDFLLAFDVVDPSIAPISVTRIQIFRPHLEALPDVEIGDGIILRNFQVVMDRNIYSLKSRMEEGSSWAVFKSTGEIQVKGPPVEYNMTEVEYISNLQTWFSELDNVTRSKITRANGKAAENKK